MTKKARDIYSLVGTRAYNLTPRELRELEIGSRVYVKAMDNTLWPVEVVKCYEGVEKFIVKYI